MELDISALPPTSRAFQLQATQPAPYHLPPLQQQGYNLQALPEAPPQNYLYTTSANRVAPLQVAQPQAYTAPAGGAVSAGAGTAAAGSSGAKAWVIILSVVVGVLVIGGGVAGVVIFTSGSGSSNIFTPICSGYTCFTGECVSFPLVCDGTYDCPVGDDESVRCSSTTPTPTPTDGSCSAEQFTCVNGSPYGNCIFITWVCDSFIDCYDQADEANCDSATATATSIPGGTTTTTAATTTTVAPDLDPNKFSCLGTSTQIEKSKVCDGTEDCPGGYDEDRCVIALGGKGGGIVKLYSVATGERYFPCGFADGWTVARSDDVCTQLGYGASAETTEVSSTEQGLASSGSSSLYNVFQTEPVVCTDGKIVHISCMSTTTCGTTSRSGKIVGGADADILDHPWQVSLQTLTITTGWVHSCGGTIVDNQWVVSTAECVKAIASDQYHFHRVLAGISSLGETITSTMDYDIEDIVLHPLYDSSNHNMDIAIIRVSSSFAYSSTIQPACLPSSGQVFEDHSAVVASGWGPTSELGSDITALQAVTVELYNYESCKTTFTGIGNSLLTGMICAGVPEGGKGTCQGDSGGPLTLLHDSVSYLVGATSWGVGCARPNYPGVFAEVSYVVDWIRREIPKIPCSGDSSSRIFVTQLCDGVEDCPGGTDEDRCIIAPGGYQGGDVRVYSAVTKSYHKFCGFADGWTAAKSDAVCSYMGYGASISTTELDSTDPGIMSTTTDFMLNALVQKNAVTCADNKVVQITCGAGTTCGTASRIGKIVGGADAEILDHPWQIAMLKQTDSGTQQFCGGTIANNNWIVTAAHCINDATPADYARHKILVGTSTLVLNYTKIYSVDKIVYHPLYSTSTFFMDIALIHVTSSIAFDNYAQPACLPAPGEIFDDLSQVIASGWGTTSEGGSSPTSLQAVTINLYNSDVCKSTFPDIISSLLDGMICAGVEEGGKDSCQGDSGGPLVVERGTLKYLVGATSFGSGCARRGFPGVYAEISYARDWIKREMLKDV